MSTGGIDTTQLTSSLYSIGSLSSTQTIGQTANLSNLSTGTQSVDTDGDNDQAASVNISKPGQLFSKLQKLKSEDPDKYKQVVSDIASKLSDAARSATGDDQKFLTGLADKFQKAANGDDSALQPPQPPQGFSQNVQALYSQNNQNNGSGDPLQQALSGTTQKSGGHHHHHGGPSADTKKTLDSIFQEIDTATSDTSTASASATTA